jgi:hypothetical protein
MPKREAPEPVEPEPEEIAEEEEPEFLNRAARRAQGRGKTQTPQSQRKGQYPHGQGTVQGPRMWGNRRSG